MKVPASCLSRSPSYAQSTDALYDHPDLTLEALNVLRLSNVSVDNERSRVHVFFTPTGCALAPGPS